jgi:hypothetical protein
VAGGGPSLAGGAPRAAALKRGPRGAGTLLGINVLDHLILGDGSESYFSFADEQLL